MLGHSYCPLHTLYRFYHGKHATFLLKNLIIHYQSRFLGLRSFGFPFYMVRIIKLNQAMVTTFYEYSKVVSSDFSMIKNIVAPSYLSSLPIKLICCLKSGFSNSFCLLKSIAISI